MILVFLLLFISSNYYYRFIAITTTITTYYNIAKKEDINGLVVPTLHFPSAFKRDIKSSNETLHVYIKNLKKKWE